MKLDPRDDRQLVRRMLRGDERAFRAFFDAHFPVLLRFVTQRVGDDDAAEEIVQRALCKAIEKLHTYRGEASLMTWLHTFCRFEMSAARCRFRRVAVHRLDDLDQLEVVVDSLLAATEDPARYAEVREVRRWVQTTLDRLPPHYGKALEWKYIESRSVREIGDRLGLSPKAAESVLTRARAAFREGFRLRDELLPGES